MKGESRFFQLSHEQDAEALREHLKLHWRAAAGRGEPLCVEVLAFDKRRTDKQNRRYRAILQQVSEQVWSGKRRTPADTWDLYMKQEILGDAEAHTSQMNASDFNAYMGKVEAMAAELGAVLELQDGL